MIPLPPVFESSLDRVTKEALIVIFCGLLKAKLTYIYVNNKLFINKL